jgi:hypothetical protein
VYRLYKEEGLGLRKRPPGRRRAVLHRQEAFVRRVPLIIRDRGERLAPLDHRDGGSGHGQASVDNLASILRSHSFGRHHCKAAAETERS